MFKLGKRSQGFEGGELTQKEFWSGDCGSLDQFFVKDI